LSEDDLANMAIDTDNDGIKELVDGWGNPVRFYRSPSGFSAPDFQAPTGSQFLDPFDASGTLVSPSWNATLRAEFETLCHTITMPKGAYLIPVIAAGGRDGKMGLDPKTMAVTTAGDATDNIYSYNLK